MVNRPCIEDGCPRLTARTRCEAHQRAKERQRGSPSRRGYDAAYRRQRQAMLEAHVVVHGWNCPGYRREPHPVSPGQLTADHVVPLTEGGRGGPLAPLCLSCNARKGKVTSTKARRCVIQVASSTP